MSDLTAAGRTPVALDRILDELTGAVSALTQGAPAQLTSAQLSAAVGSIARLFSVCTQRAGRTDLISSHDVSTTESVTLIQGLMAAQSLNTFDLALWLTRGQAAASTTESCSNP